MFDQVLKLGARGIMWVVVGAILGAMFGAAYAATEASARNSQ